MINKLQLNRIVETTAADIRRRERISEFGFYPIGGTSVDTINPVSQDYMIRDSYYMWIKNPMANAIIESFIDFVLGDGIVYKAKEKKVQEVLDDFYFDYNNNWDRKGKIRFRDMSIYGEMILKTLVSKMTGKVKVTSVNPEMVSEAFRFNDNSEDIAAFKFREDKKRYDIIRFNEMNESFEGELFYWKINSTMHQTRGLSDLFVSRDWLRLFDKSLYATMERTGLIFSFVWDITMNNATETDLRKKLQAIKSNPPQPGGVRVHNEKEEWKAVNPSIDGKDLDELYRLFKSPILAQTRMPEHFFGLGGEVNYATSLSMNAPFYRKIKGRQKEIIFIYKDMFDYVIWQAKKAGMLNGIDNFNYDIMLPEPDKEIAKNISDTVDKFSKSLVLLASNGYIEQEDAKKVIQMLFNQMGVSIDTEDTSRETEAIYDKVSKVYKDINNARNNKKS